MSSVDEGRRMKTFRDAFTRALAGVVKGMPFEDFAKFFPSVPEREARVLHDLFQQVLQELGRNSEAELEDIVQEAGLAARLGELEALCLEKGLVEGIPGGVPVRAPGAVPAAAARSASYQAKTREIEHLRAAVMSAEAEREAASRELERKRAEVLDAAARLGPLSDQLSGLHSASLAYLTRGGAGAAGGSTVETAAGGGDVFRTPAAGKQQSTL